jgi:hypothetical protein
MASPPSGNAKKGYKTPLPSLTQGVTSFQDPLHSPICSLTLLLSANEIFLTSAVGVCLCFHSQSRLKNTEELKYMCMSSGHQIWQLQRDQPTYTYQGKYRLCKTGKGCLGKWPWVSSILVERPPHHGLAMVELSGQPFSSLLGNWRKAPSPLQL